MQKNLTSRVSLEYDELVEYVKGKWNYDEENLDLKRETPIDVYESMTIWLSGKENDNSLDY